MPTLTYSVTLSGGGVSISNVISRTNDTVKSYEVTLPAGYAGTLTTRTDDDTGTITLGSGHGITTGMTVDVYWSGGVQYGVTVGTVSGTSVPIDLGSGDNLPAQDTAVVVTEQVQISTEIDGDNSTLFAISFECPGDPDAECHADMQDSGNATIEEFDLTAGEPSIHDFAGGATNVLTGNPITDTFASNGSSTASGTIKIVSLEDATP